MLLALVIFLRNQGSAQRSQVDLFGAWATVTYERRHPEDQTRVEDGDVTAHLRNASQLPLKAMEVAYTIESIWMVEDTAQSQYPNGPGVWLEQPGTETQKFFHYDVFVPPQDTLELPFKVNVAHMAPEAATQLGLLDGIKAHVDSLQLVDNAGRRWKVHPGRGSRARAVGHSWNLKVLIGARSCRPLQLSFPPRPTPAWR